MLCFQEFLFSCKRIFYPIAFENRIIRLSMNPIFLNQQDYLAEKFFYTEDYVQQMSKLAVLKLQSLNLVRNSQHEEDDDRQEMESFVQSTLLSVVPNSFVLSEEGFYFSEMEN